MLFVDGKLKLLIFYAQFINTNLFAAMSLLTRHGFIVSEDDFEPWHAEELIVEAENSIMFNTEPQPFSVFEDRQNGTIAVPRYWGEDNFGRPKKLFGHVQKSNKMVFRGELRSSVQEDAVAKSVEQLSSKGGGVLSLPCGAGKCHGIDTPILMYDGSIKMVQDVIKGDLLMGDDSTARKVISLARGIDNMYDIVPKKGDKYTVNSEHILVLKNTMKNPKIRLRLCNGVERFDVRWWENFQEKSKVHNTIESAKLFLGTVRHESVVEIEVKDYIAQNKTFKNHYKGYRTSVCFNEKPVPIDPYMIGVWLGDGTSRRPQITSQDRIIIDYFVSNLGEYGLYLTKLKDMYGYGITSIYTKNKFMTVLKQLNMICNKHIPMVYKCNSRKNRLSLLAGILDTDGSLIRDSCFDLIQKSEQLIDDIIYLCRSLGFACYKSKVVKGCKYKCEYKDGSYFRITISGEGLDEIPTLLPSKKASPRRQIKDALVTGIKVNHVGIDAYYGFVLDGNSRYVMGDFTVTHNTVVSLYIACSIGMKTLVVVHKQFLLDQWEERIKKFVPSARVGRLQRNIEDVDDCDIVVGMLQSIAMREYDDYVYSDFGLVIFDEVHVVPAPVFSRALLRLCAPYMLGLSATPVRKDGLSKVIHWFIGPLFFQHCLSGKAEVTVRTVNFDLHRRLPLNMAAATTILCNMSDRNALIVDEIIKLASSGHKVILLSDRRAHCDTIKHMLTDWKIESALYIGGMSSYELMQSVKRQVLLATFSMAKEGLDIPSLDALVLACPRSDVVQACGRILHGKTRMPPVIIDIVDQWFVGKAQYNKRHVYYKEAGFTVQ